jgi:hypothetical protein
LVYFYPGVSSTLPEHAKKPSKPPFLGRFSVSFGVFYARRAEKSSAGDRNLTKFLRKTLDLAQDFPYNDSGIDQLEQG